jgi:hypothetical protein
MKQRNCFKTPKAQRFYFKTTEDLFLKQSLHKLKNFINLKTIRYICSILGFNEYDAKNEKLFRIQKTVQLFNRFATYNGSNPYKALLY